MPWSVHVTQIVQFWQISYCKHFSTLRKFRAHLVFLPVFFAKCSCWAWKFVVTHKLQKMRRGCEGRQARTSNQVGCGAFTKGGVLSTLGPLTLAHACQCRRERKNKPSLQFLESIYSYQGSLVEWLARRFVRDLSDEISCTNLWQRS